MTFADYLRDACGWSDVSRMPDGRWVGLMPFMFTTAIGIAKDGDYASVADRWCYHTPRDAKAALDAWTMKGYVGEPDGWHRHPFSGRRRGDDPPPEFAGQKEWFAP